MSRYASYIRALATGYGLLAVNIAYSLAMVPLALAHLGKETFGLWALTMQIGAIVQLADAGMTGALNRILMDYKDDKTSISYRQTFYTMWLTFSLLGLGVALALAGLSPLLVHWLGIPVGLRNDYTSFLAAYGLVLGFSFAMKPFPMLPFVHQRSDLLNIVSAVCLILGFAVMWIALRVGWGLWSLLASFALTQLITALAVVWICFSQQYFPSTSPHPRLSRAAFREVFDYGRDRMLITIGFTTLQAAPTFLITRVLGLEANTVWAIVTRMNQLCLQIIAKIPELSYPALTEMYVRGEHDVMRRRYSNLLVVGMGIAVLCAAGIAACNRDFVRLWTGSRIHSSPVLDALLGLWLLTLILQKFLFIPASIARNLRDVRLFYLIEAIVVIVLSIFLLAPFGSVTAMAAILSAASLTITIPSNLSKSRHVLQSDWNQLLRPLGMLCIHTILPACGIAVIFTTFPVSHQWWSLILKSFIVAIVMGAFLSFLPEFRQIVTEALRRIFPRAGRKTMA